MKVLFKIAGRAWALALVLVVTALSPANAQLLQRAEQRLIDSLSTQFEKLGKGPMELRLGAGPVLTVPDSGKATLHAIVPLLSFRYQTWFAIDETQMRIDLVDSDSDLAKAGFHGGPMVKLDFGRKRLNSADTQKLGHVGSSLEAGFYAAYGFGPARLRVRARQDITDGHRGAIVEVDLRTGLYRSGPLGVGASILTTWSDRKYMQSFFGVTRAESLETGLPVFSPGAGFKDVSPAIAVEYKFSDHWSAIGSVQYVYLLNDASRSPVPRTRGLGGRTNMGVFTVYTF